MNYKKEDLQIMSKEYLIETILMLDKDVEHYRSEVKNVLKEWRTTINLIK